MLIESFIDDLKIGFRTLLKERSFCILAVGILALGICGVTTQFSVINGALLRGLNFHESDRLASIEIIDPARSTRFGVEGRLTSTDFQEFAPHQTSFQHLAAYIDGSTVNLTVNGHPQRLAGAYVTEDFFTILGVQPLPGRNFTPDDNRVGAPKVALISHQVWSRDFGSDPNILSLPVRMNGRTATIIGVMPPGFSFPINEQVWIPLYSEFAPPPRGANDSPGMMVSVLGRLKPGMTLKEANREFQSVARQLADTYPETNGVYTTARVQELVRTFTSPHLEVTLWTMLAFCGLLLIMACANVMNMQFARATLRAKEMAIRSSLGATRLRLVRQMLTENLVLALLGTMLGVLASYWVVDAIDANVRHQQNPPPSFIRFDIDHRVLLFTVVITLLAAVLSGILPALLSSQANASDALKESGRGNTSALIGKITRSIVILQILVAFFLLVGALLQAQSVVRQQNVDYGYDTERLLSARMGLMEGDYPTYQTRQRFYATVLRDLRASPDFEAAALTNRLRMAFSGNATIEVEDHVYAHSTDRSNANFELVSDGYFAVTQQSFLEGEDFSPKDGDAREPVAIVNASFARKHFGPKSPLGRRFRTVTNNDTLLGPWRRIIGVVSDVRMMGPFNNPVVDASGFYLPFQATAFGPVPQQPSLSQFATLLVRPRGVARGDAAIPALRRELLKADPHLPLYYVGTPRSHHNVFVSQNRIIADMFTVFGGVAVILASVGLYGIMSFSVNQRAQEFCIRFALGAERNQVLAMVLKQGARQCLVGLLCGFALTIGIAWLANDALKTVLFDISPFDPLTYFVVGVLLASVAFLSTLFPALRATRVDALNAFRAE